MLTIQFFIKKDKYMKYKGKEITIDSFQVKSYVSWKELESVLGKRLYKKFIKWMFCQTSYPEGVYVHDLERWLRMENEGKPTYWD